MDIQYSYIVHTVVKIGKTRDELRNESKVIKSEHPTPDWVNPYHESRDTKQNIGGKNVPQFKKDNNGFGTCVVIRT